jgi:hypothetical protein
MTMKETFIKAEVNMLKVTQWKDGRKAIKLTLLLLTYMCISFVGLGFEVRASQLQSRCSTT